MRRTGTWKAADEERDERDGGGEEQGGVGKEVTSMVDELVAVVWQRLHVIQVRRKQPRTMLI